MPRALVDLSSLDLSQDVLPIETVRAHLPHRHEFQMIDGVCHLDLEAGSIVSYKDWDPEPWWARGHIPGRPLMPGVLQCEGAAQTATLLLKLLEGYAPEQFVGLGGLENTRFRGQVTPPCRVHFVSTVGKKSGNRMARYPAQAYCGGKLVMDMELLGVLL
ncbi:MAG: beta-hydroxyacyl-ACP dehydratase [Planctomycetes bacterium]|nr:beta-hydroxyacyl-ACP dehydratase [Planctomycetota bacterium]